MSKPPKNQTGLVFWRFSFYVKKYKENLDKTSDRIIANRLQAQLIHVAHVARMTPHNHVASWPRAPNSAMLKRVRAEALSPRIESRLRCDSGDDSVDDDDVHTGGGTSTKRVLAAGVIMLVAALAIEPIPHFRMANAHRDRPGALELVRTWDDRRGVLPVSDVRDQVPWRDQRLLCF